MKDRLLLLALLCATACLPEGAELEEADQAEGANDYRACQDALDLGDPDFTCEAPCSLARPDALDVTLGCTRSVAGGFCTGTREANNGIGCATRDGEVLYRFSSVSFLPTGSTWRVCTDEELRMYVDASSCDEG